MSVQRTGDKVAIHRDKHAKEVCTKSGTTCNDRADCWTTGRLEMQRHLVARELISD